MHPRIRNDKTIEEFKTLKFEPRFFKYIFFGIKYDTQQNSK